MTNEEKYKTAYDRIKAFYEFAGLDMFKRIEHFAHWLALEAEEEEPSPEPCPFCGSTVNYNNDFGTAESEAVAIAAHNRVARAAKAAKDAEIARLERKYADACKCCDDAERRLKVAEDAITDLQSRLVASVYDGSMDPYEALKVAKDALAAIRYAAGEEVSDGKAT